MVESYFQRRLAATFMLFSDSISELRSADCTSIEPIHRHVCLRYLSIKCRFGYLTLIWLIVSFFVGEKQRNKDFCGIFFESFWYERAVSGFNIWCVVWQETCFLLICFFLKDGAVYSTVRAQLSQDFTIVMLCRISSGLCLDNLGNSEWSLIQLRRSMLQMGCVWSCAVKAGLCFYDFTLIC